mmetsp:Transcript_2457/g.3539  ORF Transcript_2457/g.3539 Transcript_2457/m.3539 type:complete len:108 (-) Transcript_2457:240-563(-)
MVALEGIENILRVGVKESHKYMGNKNKYAEFVEQCGGLDSIEHLQRHDNEEIYNKAVNILQVYFETEDGEDEDETLNPEIAADKDQFQFGFNQDNDQGGGGFNFNNF